MPGPFAPRAGAAPALAALAIMLLSIPGPAPWPAAAAGSALANADGWAAQPPGRERDHILLGWIANAPLPELMWVLRRSPQELGPVEAPIVDRALDRTPVARAELRRALLARHVAVTSARARKREGRLADVVAAAPIPVHASAFRVGMLLPVAGDYADYAATLRAGVEAGLAPHTAAGFPAEVTVWNTGQNDAPRIAAALDSAVDRCGVLVGELTSAPTEILASGARVYGTPLISPAAANENIGLMGPNVFQIGPSGAERGERLAHGTALADKRVGLLVSSDSNPAFAQGFADAAVLDGATVVSRATYAAGVVSFRTEVRDLIAKKVEVLFWDGDAREADALLRQLAHDRASMRICGGPALAPEGHHAETQFLLEGVQYVGEDWTLPEALRAAIDSASTARTGAAATPVFVRGWITGNALRAALDAGALCPAEIAAELRQRVTKDAYAESHRFLDPGVPGCELPVFRVTRGVAVRVAQE